MPCDRFCKRGLLHKMAPNVMSCAGHKTSGNMEINRPRPPRCTPRSVRLRRATHYMKQDPWLLRHAQTFSFLGVAPRIAPPRQPQDRRHRPPKGRKSCSERDVRGTRRTPPLSRNLSESQSSQTKAEKRGLGRCDLRGNDTARRGGHRHNGPPRRRPQDRRTQGRPTPNVRRSKKRITRIRGTCQLNTARHAGRYTAARSRLTSLRGRPQPLLYELLTHRSEG